MRPKQKFADLIRLLKTTCIQNTDMGFDFFDLVGSALRSERRNTMTDFDPELFRQWKILFHIFHDSKLSIENFGHLFLITSKIFHHHKRKRFISRK